MLGGHAQAYNPIFVMDNNGKRAILDIDTLTISDLVDLSIPSFDFDLDPISGQQYSVGNGGRLYTINGGTITNTGPNGQAGNSLEVASDGTIYTVKFDSQSVFVIDPVTGLSSVPVAGDTGFTSAGDLQFFEGKLYLAALGNLLAEINVANPAASSLVFNHGIANVYALAVGQGTLYGITSASDVYSIDPGSQSTLFIGNFSGQGLSTIGGAASLQAVVPEPSTYIIMAGFLAIAAFATRFKSRNISI